MKLKKDNPESNILFSIKPKYAELIFSGQKQIEYRRQVPSRKLVGVTIFLYASAPVQQVLGTITVKKHLIELPIDLWRKTRKLSGMKLKDYERYFKSRGGAMDWMMNNLGVKNEDDRHENFKKGYTTYAHGLVIDEASLFIKPQNLNIFCGLDRPPQNFCYFKKLALF